MEPRKKVHPAIAALIVIVLIGIVATAVIVINNANNSSTETSQDTTTNTSSNSSPSENTVSQEENSAAYANGTYSATGSYISPGGRESIELTVTIENGVITATELAQNATDRDAKQYQEAFAGGYKSLIVGKAVDEVSLSRVAGSSLTSNGFNDALEQIKEDAAA